MGHCPLVLNTSGEGIEFSPSRAKKNLEDNLLNTEHLPYQWIPFNVAWEKQQLVDPKLNTLSKYSTVVKLQDVSSENINNSLDLIQSLPPHTLFTFRNLKQISAPGVTLRLSLETGVHSLLDSRTKTTSLWKTLTKTEFPPVDIVDQLTVDDRTTVLHDGVSFLVSAPITQNTVRRTDDYLPIHVFYPTEQIGPVSLLLHAEFLVKSDRTALLPLAANSFNMWVSDRLSYYICKFVNDSFCPETPSSHVALLVPFEERNSHPVAYALWETIHAKAGQILRFADCNSHQRLKVDEAKLISVSVSQAIAREILKKTEIQQNLLHPSFDSDTCAMEALKELGCDELDDDELLSLINHSSQKLSSDRSWIINCWRWISNWLEKRRYGDEREERIEAIKNLQVLPIGERLLALSDTGNSIVTWREETSGGFLPRWLPLVYIEDWFRDWLILEVEKSAALGRLIKEIGISKPDPNVIQQATSKAIEMYWTNNGDKPEIFLQFIAKQDWCETSEPIAKITECPILTSSDGQKVSWEKARNTYLGNEWDEGLLEQLYNGQASISWAKSLDPTIARDSLRSILEWLGVVHYPRVIDNTRKQYIWQIPDDDKLWKHYLLSEHDLEGRQVQFVFGNAKLDGIQINELDLEHAALLIRLLARNWDKYYKPKSSVRVEGSRSRERYNRPWHVKSRWWWEVSTLLSIPTLSDEEDHIPLERLWIPNKQTKRALGDLLPTVNLDSFNEDATLAEEWFVHKIGLRSRSEQLLRQEWEDILSCKIPKTVPVEVIDTTTKIQDRVTGWYTACLDWSSEQNELPDGVFEQAKLLCRRGNSWDFVDSDHRYLNDNNEYSDAFSEDIWLFNIPSRLAKDALNYFGLRSLSDLVEVKVRLGEISLPTDNELSDRLTLSLPYIWAWRSSQRKSDLEKLMRSIKEISIRSSQFIIADLKLNDIYHERERHSHVENSTIILQEAHVNEFELAQALAVFLNAPSEADFYENLLRCKDDAQRFGKVLNRGLSKTELESSLRQFTQPISETEIETTKPSPKDRSAEIKQKGNDSSSTNESKTHVGDKPPSKESMGNSVSEKHNEDNVTEPLKLKNSSTAAYIVNKNTGEATKISAGTNENDFSGRSDSGSFEQQQLTELEKVELEKAGREFAKCELEKNGYKVEDTPFENPGFDLKGIKGKVELRVEVKAHVGKSSIIDLTQRQYKEYLNQQEYKWELWNIEHLRAYDDSKVIITKYVEIPGNSLSARTLRVNLKMCR